MPEIIHVALGLHTHITIPLENTSIVIIAEDTSNITPNNGISVKNADMMLAINVSKKMPLYLSNPLMIKVTLLV